MPRGMSEARVISVIDDDESVRNAVRSLLRSLGYRVAVFASGEDFMGSEHLDDTACLIIDVRMPGMSGLDLQRRLLAASRRIPIIFITGLDDDDARRQALDAGALAFLRKPFREQTLMDAVRSACNV